MKKLIFISALFLTSCEGTTPAQLEPQTFYSYDYYSNEVKLKDGRIVQCVSNNHGSLACDFEHTRLIKLEK